MYKSGPPGDPGTCSSLVTLSGDIGLLRQRRKEPVWSSYSAPNQTTTVIGMAGMSHGHSGFSGPNANSSAPITTTARGAAIFRWRRHQRRLLREGSRVLAGDRSGRPFRRPSGRRGRWCRDRLTVGACPTSRLGAVSERFEQLANGRPAGVDPSVLDARDLCLGGAGPLRKRGLRPAEFDPPFPDRVTGLGLRSASKQPFDTAGV